MEKLQHIFLVYLSSFTRDMQEFIKMLHIDSELRDGSWAAAHGETVNTEAQLMDSLLSPPSSNFYLCQRGLTL